MDSKEFPNFPDPRFNPSTPSYSLPEKLLKSRELLLELYKKEERSELCLLLDQGRLSVIDNVDYDNWNGGQTGHAVNISVANSVFIEIARRKSELEAHLREDLNDFFNEVGEFVYSVSVSPSSESVAPSFKTSGNAIETWPNTGHLRLFISHRAPDKCLAHELKIDLESFGVSAFVAHDDVVPTEPWREEILEALRSMHAFAALCTEGFGESNWTQQEIGFAIAARVPIIPVCLGEIPTAFIGSLQGLKSPNIKNLALPIVQLLLKKSPVAFEAWIQAAEQCSSFEAANQLAACIDFTPTFSKEQALRIAAAYNRNSQLNGSFGFTGSQPLKYGKGLAARLGRCSELSVNAIDGRIDIS